ncbi:hypothetical protein DRO64_06220 [Candidatus Bathyarchaeota archaeon]|nr:MAG: hypothetical protein DRO64_06220 [Candidatus Bathyarchaeota archaeon]
MCRLLGVLSVKPTNARRYLLDDPCSLYIQSMADPRRLQGDGWGIGYYRNGKPVLIKDYRPVYRDYRGFFSAVQKVRSNIIIAHIRRASNPRGLKKEALISVENSQPFTYGRYIFAHNGTIMIPDELAETLGSWKMRIRGLNDSEVYFWFLMKKMSEGLNLAEALREFKETMRDLWVKVRSAYPDKHQPYHMLNIIFSDGEALYAYCEYDENAKPVKSLCFRDQLVYQMCYKIRDDELVIASERTSREENWRTIRNGEMLTGRIENGRITVKTINLTG